MQTPLAINRNKQISRSAKSLYARLVLFSGKDGRCNPSHETLASELGIRPRQIRNLLKELSECELVKWRRTRSSASYEIFPPENFKIPDRQLIAALDRQRIAGEIGNALPIKRGLKTGSLKDVRDIDCPPTKRTPRVSPADVNNLPPSIPKAFPALSLTVARYMADNPRKPQPQDYPNPSKVVEIMDASGGESEQAVVDCLAHLYNNRGLRPGTANGPRSFAWFPVVVQEYFSKRADREMAAPCGYHEWEDRNQVKEENAILKQAAAFGYASRKTA